MDRNIYTYEVDHGEEAPSVGYGTEINGGKVIAVAFTDQLSNNQRAQVIIESLLEDEFFYDVVIDKLEKIQALI